MVLPEYTFLDLQSASGIESQLVSLCSQYRSEQNPSRRKLMLTDIIRYYTFQAFDKGDEGVLDLIIRTGVYDEIGSILTTENDPTILRLARSLMSLLVSSMETSPDVYQSLYLEQLLIILLANPAQNKERSLRALSVMLRQNPHLAETLWNSTSVTAWLATFADPVSASSASSTSSSSASSSSSSSSSPPNLDSIARKALFIRILQSLLRVSVPPGIDLAQLDTTLRTFQHYVEENVENTPDEEAEDWIEAENVCSSCLHILSRKRKEQAPETSEEEEKERERGPEEPQTSPLQQPQFVESSTSTSSFSSSLIPATQADQAQTPTSTTTTTREEEEEEEEEEDSLIRLSYHNNIAFDHLVEIYASADSSWTYRFSLAYCTYQARTRNFQYLKLYNNSSNSANTYTFLCALNNKGKFSFLQRTEDMKYNASSNYTFRYATFVTFKQEAWDGECDDYAYYPITNGGYINIYKAGKFIGKVEDASGNKNKIFLTGVGTSGMSSQRYISGKSLRGEHKRILILNNSSQANVQTQAGLIGVDDDGNEGLNKFKPITLPAGGVKFGVHGVASGKNHFFFQVSNTNVIMRMDKNGNTTAYTIVDPEQTTQLTPNAVQCGVGNFIELENGDCMFAVADSTKHFFYFLYCNDSPSLPPEEVFVTVYRSPTYFCESATGSWPDVWQYPFIENGNFVYFFPTYGADIDSNSTIGNLSGSYMKETHSKYIRYDKTEKSFSPPIQLPWMVANFQAMSPNAHAKTEGGYIWVFPTGDYNASTHSSTCLVIAPDGTTQNIDLGTEKRINWFYAGSSWNGYKQQYPFHAPTGQGVYWYQSDRPFINMAVNSHGLGALISPDFKYILLFKGNGCFRVFDYSSGFDDFMPYSLDVSNVEWNGLFAGTDGFFLSCRHSSLPLAVRNVDSFSDGFIYISTNGSSFDPPAFSEIVIPSKFADLRNYEDFGTQLTFDDYEKRFALQHSAWSTAPVGTDRTWGFSSVIESQQRSHTS